jgi:23S rRNA (adenine2030-N6)-methyltransferase
MLSYRHLFHAGNFADVFKHALLSRLLVLLMRKDRPLAYVDVYAGLGCYDLAHPWARKLAEYRHGIARLWPRDDIPALLEPYLGAVREDNRDGTLARYPGSPLIAARLLRPHDRLVLCELNRDDHDVLRHGFAGDRRVGVHYLDAALGLKAFLPPDERRGLVLIDPPYDRAGELRRVLDALAAAHRRWASGVFAVWYPLMQLGAMQRFERDAASCGVSRILQLELAVHPEIGSTGLRGCGVLVVNPPYGLSDEAPGWSEWLWQVLSPQREGGWRVRWLVPE